MVGTRVITRSEVELHAQIQLILLGGVERLAQARSQALRQTALAFLVRQAMIYEEAQRLAFQRIRREALDKEVKRFRSRFPNEASYQRFLRTNEVSEGDVAEIFRRSLLVNKFTEDSVRLNVLITESDVDEYVVLNRFAPAFAKKKPDEIRRIGRETLFKRRYAQARERWIADLRKRTRIRVLVSFR